MIAVATTKADRQQLLRRLLADEDLRSQRDVLRALQRRGVRTTQATVSRDLDDLGAVKVRNAAGDLAYRLGADPRPRSARERLDDTLARFLLAVASSGNLAVLRTPPACAQPVASAIDLAEVDGVVATVAGDDTVLVVAEDGLSGAALARRFRPYLPSTAAVPSAKELP